MESAEINTLHQTKIEYIADAIVSDDEWDAAPRYGTIFPSLAAVYGERVGADGELEACSLPDMVEIDTEIAANVLVDEDSRTPLLTIAPYPKASTTGKSPEAQANNDAWLRTIRDGHWPIPGSYKRDYETKDGDFSDELSYDLHDSADKHLSFMLLAPREMQHEITEAAHHGLSRRLNALDDPEMSKGLVLRGETDSDVDKRAYTWRGEAFRGDMDAINTIDQISDDPNFLPLINDLLSLKSDEERGQYMEHYAALADAPTEELDTLLEQSVPEDMDTDEWVSAQSQKTLWVGAQMRMIAGITNFNMRHREGRDLTQEEISQAQHQYLSGIVRVADKLAS